MGREVRRVPADWVHPRQDDPRKYQPLYDASYKEAAREWKEEFLAWEAGHNASMDRPRGPSDTEEYWEYAGNPPDPTYYRPEWTDEVRTHFQMYESTSEGTPISPVMETPEELARWLVEHNAPAFAGVTADYEAWLRVAQGGYAPSLILSPEGIQSGVEALTDTPGD